MAPSVFYGQKGTCELVEREVHWGGPCFSEEVNLDLAFVLGSHLVALGIYSHLSVHRLLLVVLVGP